MMSQPPGSGGVCGRACVCVMCVRQVLRHYMTFRNIYYFFQANVATRHDISINFFLANVEKIVAIFSSMPKDTEAAMYGTVGNTGTV